MERLKNIFKQVYACLFYLTKIDINIVVFVIYMCNVIGYLAYCKYRLFPYFNNEPVNNLYENFNEQGFLFFNTSLATLFLLFMFSGRFNTIGKTSYAGLIFMWLTNEYYILFGIDTAQYFAWFSIVIYCTITVFVMGKITHRI